MLRAFCYVTDVIRGLLIIAADNDPARTFNLSNETEEISIIDLASLIAGYVPGTRVTVMKHAVDSSKYCIHKRIPLDCSAIMELGWRPEVSLEDGLNRTIDSFLN